MSDAIFNQFSSGMKTLNTELTKAFARNNTVCYLLKRKPNSKDFEIVAQITSGFFSRWNEFRQQTLFRFAGQADTFNNLVAQTSYVGYGVPDTDNQIEVYKIEDDQRDKIAPNASSPFWKLYADKQTVERFTIP